MPHVAISVLTMNFGHDDYFNSISKNFVVMTFSIEKKK